MARISDNPYTTYHLTARHTPGEIFDGVDELGLPAKFRYGKHVNAVATLLGHCAFLVTAPSAGVFTFTNDYTGGADGNALAGPQAAGAYCVAGVPQGYYTYLLVRGYCSALLGDGSVAAGEGISPKAADGTWDTLAAVPAVMCGYCIADDSGSPTTFPGYVQIPGT